MIVEDEAIFSDQLEMLCEELGYVVTGVYEDAFSALDAFHREPPDLLLSDINLVGDIDGITLATKLNAKVQLPTIFITSLVDDETFQRAQAVLPVAFLLKPFNPLQLQRSIELAISQLAQKERAAVDFEQQGLHLNDSFFVKVKNRLEKIRVADILYVAADGRYSMIHTVLGHKYAVRIPLSTLEERLGQRQFMRSHRSYFFNLNYLQSVDVGEMTLQLAGGKVPLSKGFKEAVLQRIEQL